MKKYISCIIVVILVLAVAPDVTGQSVNERDIAGVVGLRIAPGAAQAGAAEAFSAVPNDIFALYYNPAGAIEAGRYSAGIMHHEWIEDIRSEYVAGLWRPDKVAVGVSLLYNSVGDIERRDQPTTEPISYFDAQDFAAGLSGSFYIGPDFSVGATLKLIYQKIDIESGTAIGFDLGGYYRFIENLEVGLAVANLGSKMKIENYEADLPTVIRAGGAYTWKTLRAGLAIVTPTDDETHFHIGAENTISDILTLRAGYATGYDIKDLAFGFGVRHDFVSVDYAYTPIEADLGDSHRFSLTFSWR